MSSLVDTSLTYLVRAATEFVHCAASDQPESQTLTRHFSDEFNIMDRLRAVRCWAAHLPQSDTDRADSAMLLTDVIANLTNLADSILLLIYKDNNMSPHWQTLSLSTQADTLLMFSILLQSLSNAFSALRSLNRVPSVHDIRRILTALLCCGRGSLLLCSGTEHPLYANHAVHLWRLNSHTSFALFATLIAFQNACSCPEESDFTFLYTSLMLSADVFTSLCDVATDHTVCEDTLLQARKFHYQLLLSQLAKLLYKFHPTISPTYPTVSASVTRICAVTGIALFFQHGADEDGPSSSSPLGNARAVFRTVRPCLLFWRHFVTPLSYTERSHTIHTMVSLLETEYDTWFVELSKHFRGSPHEPSMLCTQCISEYVLYRGLVHILSDVVFSTDRSDTVTADNPCSASLTQSKMSNGNGTNFDGAVARQITFHIDPAVASQLWEILCNILVLLGLVEGHMDSTTMPVEPSSRTAFGEPCTVIPSRMCKNEQPVLDPTSPLSMYQAVGFKQDCIRCMAGLLSLFPSLSSKLASHRLDRFPLDPPPSVSHCAFDHLLNATNRDSFNPFSCEWAIFATKLALHPVTETPDALEGALLLAKRMEDMKLLR
ncbi:unnamed protein product [Dicrocoelium dendriticum]|nr:unnamed protein product [Dicrocoelium dendriticum]